MFVAEREGNIVGFIALTHEPVIHRVLLDCLVHPAHRRKGLARQLLERAIKRASELNVDLMHISARQDNVLAQKVLSRLEFKVARRFLQMGRELDKVTLAAKAPGPFEQRPLQPCEEEVLTRLQNRAFAGHWGYNPNTVRDTVYSLNACGGSPSDVIMVLDGEIPAGYCWTKLDCESAPRGNDRKGYIFMLGVSPERRGKGIGMLALTAGLVHLKRRGVRTVELTVDSENTAACRLYRSAGFSVRATDLYYEKKIG
jgi:mycothiol synthase